MSLPTLAFVVNPAGHAAIVYDSPTGKRTVLTRGTIHGFAWYGSDAVNKVNAFWRTGRAIQAEQAGGEFRELAKVEGWTVEVSERELARVLSRGGLTGDKRSGRGGT